MDDLAATVVRDAKTPADALDAECWASELLSTFRDTPLPDGDAEEVFVPALVRALEQRGSANALATLRALSAVGSETHRKRAAAAADRLLARGRPEPKWASQVGRAEPVCATLMFEDAFDDGMSVFIEYAMPGCTNHTRDLYRP
jgi:hypothetical protein